MLSCGSPAFMGWIHDESLSPRTMNVQPAVRYDLKGDIME